MDAHQTYINNLAQQIYADNKVVGWWDDPDRCLFTCLQLVSTEIAEATEGARKNLMDTHLEGWKMEEVEYADAMIRVLDLGAHLNLRYRPDVAIAHSFCNALNEVGKQHLGLNLLVSRWALNMCDYEYKPNATYKELMEYTYSDLIKSIIQVSINRGGSLYECMEEKLEYNRHRADHKRENRAKENGKQF